MIQAKEINIQQTSETICKSDILCKLYNYRFWGKGRYALKNKKNNAVSFYVKLTIYLKDLKLTALLRIESGKKSCSIHTLYQLSNAMNVTTDSLLKGDKVETKEYKDREIIDNILNNCDEKQLKAIKEVLVAICYNFDNLNK